MPNLKQQIFVYHAFLFLERQKYTVKDLYSLSNCQKWFMNFQTRDFFDTYSLVDEVDSNQK